ncbi:hypothetical protein [Povalibacter sp.]|uniref:hypothetical protein n=1 Tax=Povalibacter sp. TaxID=1962978 RepID=UPI002F3F644E
MAADVLLDGVKTDTVGREVSIRMIGSQIPPVSMSIQIAITGAATVAIQGRLHRNAPWAQIGETHDTSCLLYISPIPMLRAVSTGTDAGASVSVWAAWGI